ncbi:MAG TPA: hypothetical protein VFG55_00345, partial [Rhodanobacteraceae bacterium]|nr:hypothetical protein [Rhodanobacteraceae bacterium]
MRPVILILLILCAAGIPSYGRAGESVTTQTAAIGSGHSAMWYDPARSGEGWVLEVLADDFVLLDWYTYDEQGGQRWLQGIGEIV